MGCSSKNGSWQNHPHRTVEFELHRRTQIRSLAPSSAAMGTPLNWIAFNLFIAIAIALDLRVFHHRPHKIALREAAIASFGWIAVSVLFGFGVLYFRVPQPPLEFFTGYLIENALSIDHLFLFLLTFHAS